jgi:hypothetical protein
VFNVNEILKKSCDKLGLKRIVFNNNKVPTSIENVVIFPFFGDMRSSFILSSLLLRRIKEEAKASKYFILLSWPGHESLYPYVDEYWTIEEDVALEKLRFQINNFSNNSSYYTLLIRSLNEYFYEIMTDKDLIEYYDKGITKEFFDKFKHVKVSLPTINSSSSLGIDFARHIAAKDLKVFIYPSIEINIWKMGRCEKVRSDREFWITLVKRLISEGHYPVIYRDLFCHDISADTHENCLHLWDKDLSKIMSAMRATGFVLDFFTGISRLAICSRTPFLMFDERNRFNALKEYEIDDLCAKDLPKDYIFSFPTIISGEDKNSWKNNLLDAVVSKLGKIIPLLNRDLWPSTAASNKIVPYDYVRKNKIKKFGSRFIKINREEM